MDPRFLRKKTDTVIRLEFNLPAQSVREQTDGENQLLSQTETLSIPQCQQHQRAFFVRITHDIDVLTTPATSSRSREKVSMEFLSGRMDKTARLFCIPGLSIKS